ncbi:Sec2p domain-containing protein [Favolaschia claudopus]|uniref:Sec2p domain-containing protein n=1 Tax=Favolaschia claudopus TaxID=2862362 RepID=A0AAV9ZGQ5_9AGAR
MVDAPEVIPETAKSPAPSINGVPPSSPTPKSKFKSTTTHRLNNSVEADAQEMVITSLRAQIQDLFSQVTQLNGKLVKSYDRVSDLEDDLHVANAQGRQHSLKISQLELERTQHLSALNTGLLVEKSHVTAELTRLMEKATEEAAQRGQAETAKADIEKDLDDLSATLFAQANTMVAEARYSQATSERRVEQAETALKGAEEMVGMMQQQMQELQYEKDEAERKAREMAVLMGKGKWVDRRRESASTFTKEKRLLSSHIPYQEFLMFVAHLRSVHPSSPSSPPAMATLLPMAFLARLSSEDSEPTVRLDLAPSLNWLSRRSVLAAIHTGQLTIEPMSSSVVLSESSSTNSNIPGLNSSNTNISCALCGTPIFSNTDFLPHYHTPPPAHPSIANGANTNSWSASLKKLTSNTPNGTPAPPPRSLSRPSPHSQTQQTDLSAPYPPQIHVFRIATPLPPPQPMNPPPRTSSPSPFLPSVGSSRTSPPPPSPSPGTTALSNLSNALTLTQSASASTAIYPLCTSGWCLARLRATCTLWGFVRTGIVERVWEEEMPNVVLPVPPPASSDHNNKHSANGIVNGQAPPVPPRRRGLWGMASKFGERAVSWSGEGKKVDSEREKTLPTPPPIHPTISAPVKSTPLPSAPPLPKRSESRKRVSMAPPPPAENEPHVDSEAVVAAPAESVSAVKAEEANHTQKQRMKRMSAHQVPLPDSRPATPVVEHGQHDGVGAVPTTPGGGGAPPPLPRRAAARAVRPVPPPPGTPAATTMTEASAVAAVPDAAVDESAAEGAPVSVSVSVSPTTAAVEEESKEGPAAAVKADVPAEETGDAPAVDTAAAPGPIPEGKKGDEEGDKADSTGIPPTDPSPIADDKKEEEGEKLITNTNEPLYEDPEEGDEKKDGEDREAYVGDVTWEERTWKELVRLREDMFWARVGAVRS